MDNRFDRQSFSIGIDAGHVPFDILFIQAPAAFLEDFPFLQYYIHELLHFWQTLSSGYLMNLALGEWINLNKFEKTGIAVNDVGLMEQFTRPDPKLGFSVADLSESLCRFWELHILNPEQLINLKNRIPSDHDREEYIAKGNEILKTLTLDNPIRKYSPAILAKLTCGSLTPYKSRDFDELLFEHLKENDQYFLPFAIVRAAFGSTLATVLFPIIGYFALQTKHPISFFREAVNGLIPKYKPVSEHKINVNDFWRTNFKEIHEECCRINLSHFGSVFTPGWDVLRSRDLETQPICNFYRTILHFIRQDYYLQGKLFHMDLDPIFSIPGDPDNRTVLSFMFRPPITIFNNGFWTVESAGDIKKLIPFFDIYEMVRFKSEEQGISADEDNTMSSSNEKLAQSSKLMLQRVSTFREACTLRKFNL
ncbi:MAG: hypothetical protein NT040_12710 [Bacteroidetes bacterium]|nr:hypothetical protein [Bacteroidota bacterium]